MNIPWNRHIAWSGKLVPAKLLAWYLNTMSGRVQDLNERFASYIEKVRFLEAQNRKLADELDKLKSRWGKETTQIKAMYQAELDEARRLLDDAEKEKARLEIRVASLEEQLEEMRLK